MKIAFKLDYTILHVLKQDGDIIYLDSYNYKKGNKDKQVTSFFQGVLNRLLYFGEQLEVVG